MLGSYTRVFTVIKKRKQVSSAEYEKTYFVATDKNLLGK